MHCAASVTVRAPIDQVFGWLDETDRLKQWVSGLEDVAFLKPGVPRGAGTRFLFRLRERGRMTAYEGEVTAYRPPNELAVRLSSAHFALDVRYRLASRDEGTWVEQTVVLGPLGWPSRLMLPLAGVWLRVQQARQLARFKAAVERAAGLPRRA